MPITELFTLSNQDYKISLLLPKFLYTKYPIVARALVQPLGRVRARAKVSCIQPKFNLDIGLHSFVFSASRLWNQYAKFIIEICSPKMSGIVIPGSVKNSDLSASASVIKSKMKKILLDEQKSGCELTW